MQSLKEVNSFGIKKGMDLAQLMSVVQHNLHGESTIQIQEFKKTSKANINPQVYDFFPLTEDGSLKNRIMSGFGVDIFLDIMNSNQAFKEKTLASAYIDDNKTVYKIPEFKVNVTTKDYCRFFSIAKKEEIEDKITKNYYNDRLPTFPKLHGLAHRRMEDTEFITNNFSREIDISNTKRWDKNITSFSSPNVFAGNRSTKELEQIFDYFGKDNFHKVVATNEEQGYALVHKITVKVDFPHSNYFQFNENSDLELEVNVEIFHQYFLSGRNDEGGYFITAIVFPDPDMLLDLIRTQDFQPFLTWFNREDQGYQRIQGDILYKIIPEDDLDKHTNVGEDKREIHSIFSNIELDTLYHDYLGSTDPLQYYEHTARFYLDGVIVNNPSKIYSMDDFRKLEKQAMKSYLEKDFNFSHHRIAAFGSRKNKLLTHIQMVSKDRINQYILVYGSTRCILQHDQHESRALTIPQNSVLLISHQRGKDISNLFAD
jgi:hypothetical protein